LKHILCSIIYFKNCAIHEIKRKIYGRHRQAAVDNIIQRTRFAGWITKATDTHSEFVTLLALALRPWLREGASILHLYIHALFSFVFSIHGKEMKIALVHDKWHWNVIFD
jgi:hypothetical protein